MVIEKIKNLTPHTVVIYKEADTDINKHTGLRTLKNGATPILELPSEGNFRLRSRANFQGEIYANGLALPVYQNSYAVKLEDMPEEKDGTVYIVSAIAAKEIAITSQRKDFFVVNGAVRNYAGGVIGCTSLAKV